VNGVSITSPLHIVTSGSMFALLHSHLRPWLCHVGRVRMWPATPKLNVDPVRTVDRFSLHSYTLMMAHFLISLCVFAGAVGPYESDCPPGGTDAEKTYVRDPLWATHACMKA
jgi:hypothetical protein